jgi:hypothetical protein
LVFSFQRQTHINQKKRLIPLPGFTALFFHQRKDGGEPLVASQ